MIKTLNPVAINEYQDLAKIDFLTGKEKSVIDLATFFKFLIDKKVLPQSEYARKIIKCSSSDTKNDILKITVNNETIYLDLFAALIEIDGYISTTEKSGNWSMRISTAHKSSDVRCTKNATFTYRCCSGTSWTKEVSSKDISTSNIYETILGELSKSSDLDSNVVSIKTFNSLIDAVNKIIKGLKSTDDYLKETLESYQYSDDYSHFHLPQWQDTFDLSDSENVIDQSWTFNISENAGKALDELGISTLNCVVAPYLSNTENCIDKVEKAFQTAYGTVSLPISKEKSYTSSNGEVHYNYSVSLNWRVNKNEENSHLLLIMPRIHGVYTNVLKWDELVNLSCEELQFDHFWSIVPVMDMRPKNYHDEYTLGDNNWYAESKYVSNLVYTQLASLKSQMTSEQYESFAKELSSIQEGFFKSNMDLNVSGKEWADFCWDLETLLTKARKFINA